MAFIDLEKVFDSPASGDMLGFERVKNGERDDFGDKINVRVCWKNDCSQDWQKGEQEISSERWCAPFSFSLQPFSIHN